METGIGEALRTARRQHGRSLADAAAETRVRETYLAALEEEEFGALGGGVYVKGFLRSYAKFLGLDPDPLLDAYRNEYETEDEAATMSPGPMAPMGPRERRSPAAVVVVAAGALLLVLAAIGIMAGGNDNGQLQERGPAPVRDDPPADRPEVSPTPAPVTPTPTPQDIEGVEVVVSVTGTISWMRVQVDGATIIEGEQERGYARTFTGDEVVTVRIGDASAVSLEANGQDQGRLGGAGEVVVVSCDAGETECDVEVVA